MSCEWVERSDGVKAHYTQSRVLPRPSLVVVIWLAWVFVHICYVFVYSASSQTAEVWLGY